MREKTQDWPREESLIILKTVLKSHLSLSDTKKQILSLVYTEASIEKHPQEVHSWLSGSKCTVPE